MSVWRRLGDFSGQRFSRSKRRRLSHVVPSHGAFGKWVVSCALLLCCASAANAAEPSTKVLSLPEVQPWTGDFDGMLKRRVIRILVVPSKTFFFLNKGDTLGLIAETGQEFEKWINKRHAKGSYDIKVEFVPTRRDRILRELIDGKGD